jgi:ABC-type transport system involved in multi-copper enzyme maturation permease subunit
MSFSVTTVLYGAALALLQIVAAIPWLAVVFLRREEIVQMVREPFSPTMMRRYGIALILILVGACFGLLVQDPTALQFSGHVYGATLQLQLTADLFVLIFLVLLAVWPKGGAVALAAFREGVRQPMFWLIFGIGFAALTIAPFWPYFTFGEDHIMVKDLGLDTVMLAAVFFGALAASISITEEIEGRTAVTLMSKPLSRRQFLLGKFLGITLAALAMFVLLGWYYQAIVEFKPWWDKQIEPPPPPVWLTDFLVRWQFPGVVRDFLYGAGLWTANALDTLPGLILTFSQVMVLVALAVALATRVPMVVNLTTVFVVFMLAHLAPVLVAIGIKAKQDTPNSPVAQILAFMSQLFDVFLPNLESFRIDPALVSDSPLATGPFFQYVGAAALYGVVYTSIILLFGLILFEDRDLA